MKYWLLILIGLPLFAQEPPPPPVTVTTVTAEAGPYRCIITITDKSQVTLLCSTEGDTRPAQNTFIMPEGSSVDGSVNKGEDAIVWNFHRKTGSAVVKYQIITSGTRTGVTVQ